MIVETIVERTVTSNRDASVSALNKFYKTHKERSESEREKIISCGDITEQCRIQGSGGAMGKWWGRSSSLAPAFCSITPCTLLPIPSYHLPLHARITWHLPSPPVFPRLAAPPCCLPSNHFWSPWSALLAASEAVVTRPAGATARMYSVPQFRVPSNLWNWLLYLVFHSLPIYSAWVVGALLFKKSAGISQHRPTSDLICYKEADKKQ